jgi:Heat induced stress protein YflT domain
MSQAETPVGSSIVAVYPDHAAAEKAVHQLHNAGFANCDLSIIGRDLAVKEEPVGFVSPGDYAKAGAATGASFGGLFGLLIGAAVVLIPGVGPVIVAGPLAAALLAGMEGALAGSALGGLAGALVGWGVPRDRALKYATQVEGGKFIVVVRGIPEVVDRARNLLAHPTSEHLDVYEPASSWHLPE